jgi:uncharacterized protein (DUF58 family)
MLDGAPAGDWWIALDFDRRVQAGYDESDSTAELGVILAASLSDQGLRNHRAVGLLSNGDPPLWIRPQFGEHRRWEILRSLATLTPGDTSLAALLDNSGPTLGRQASLIIITPSTQSEWLEPLAHLRWRGILPTLIFIDPASFGAPADARPLSQVLTGLGIVHHVVTRTCYTAKPGPVDGVSGTGISTTGKAVPTEPRDMTWRKLG